MELSNQEKELIKILLEKELKEIDEVEEDIRPNVSFLAAEEKYEEVLRKLIKRF